MAIVEILAVLAFFLAVFAVLAVLALFISYLMSATDFRFLVTRGGGGVRQFIIFLTKAGWVVRHNLTFLLGIFHVLYFGRKDFIFICM